MEIYGKSPSFLENSMEHRGFIVRLPEKIVGVVYSRIGFLLALPEPRSKNPALDTFHWNPGCLMKGSLDWSIVGGFKHFFIFTPTWENDPIWRAYFSELKPPTSGLWNNPHITL